MDGEVLIPNQNRQVALHEENYRVHIRRAFDRNYGTKTDRLEAASHAFTELIAIKRLKGGA